MKRMEEARKQYENIQIPKELSERVAKEIEKADKRRMITAFRTAGRRGLVAAAAATLIFTAGLNTSMTFAMATEKLPVIGAVAKVLTFRSYERTTEDWKIQVDIPNIEMISQDFKGLEMSVNEEILQLCENYARESEKRAEEYKEAFMATGGTEEEWAAHKIGIKVWYEVKSQNEKYLSLVIRGAENWNSAGNTDKYYNIDLESGTLITLKDVLGDNYAEVVAEQVEGQMTDQQSQIPEITEDRAFYMNEAGHPVVVFEKYEIAPGSAGIQEFELAIE